MEIIEINGVNEAEIRKSILALYENGLSWSIALTTKEIYDTIDVDNLTQLKAYKGDYELLEIINNLCVKIGFIGENMNAEDLIVEPYILYMHSN
jgi:hypothetical protein